MPTYDYKCNACDHEWEVFQSIKANPLRKCPDCGKLKAKRVIGSGAGIIFKGSGFYETDYRSKSYKDAAKADRDAQKKADAKPDTKSKSDSPKSKESSTKGTSSSD